jgi:hypothetical protein
LSQYYYIVASLPFLSFDTEKTVHTDEYLDLCRRQASQKDYELLRSASFDQLLRGNYSNGVLNTVSLWEKTLRNEMVSLRSQKMGTETQDTVFAEDIPEAKEAAREAFNQSNPLQGELTLTHARWDLYEELEVNYFFEIEKLVLYYLKLQLLERKDLFQKEYGKEQFDQIYESIVSVE